MPEFIEYIEECGDSDKAKELKQEYETIAEQGADKAQFYRFKRKVIRAKHKAERLIA
jgi:erythromycin esterase-like protein